MGSPKSDSIQHATIKEPKLFWNGNSVYDMVKLKPLRAQLVAEVAMQEKKLKLQKENYTGI